jgi:hypothetical protein
MKMLKIIDDITNNEGVTTFEFNDGSTLDAIQMIGEEGAPFVAVDTASDLQCQLVKQWSNCIMYRRY